MSERCTSEKKAMRPLWALSITTEVNGKTEHTRLLFNDNLKAEERKKNIEKINKEKNVLCSCTLDFYDSYPLLDRLLMLFDGWAAQFDEMPTRRPEITVSENGVLFLDNQLLFNCDTEIEAALIDVEYIILYVQPEGKRVIAFDWHDDSEPVVGEIYTEES